MSLFGGLECTTGLLEWTTGTLEWTTGPGILEWISRMATYLTRSSLRWGGGGGGGGLGLDRNCGNVYFIIAMYLAFRLTLQKHEDCFNPVWLPQLQFKGHLICM